MEPSYYDRIWALLESMREDNEKILTKNNKSAGLRIRKDIKQMKKLLDSYRKVTLKK